MSNPRNRNLLFIIAALVLTNIAVLAYFLWMKPHPDPKKRDNKDMGITEKLKAEVGFNDDQVAQYKLLKEEQWTSIKPMFDAMRKAKDSLFRLLSDPSVNDSVINKASDAIAQRQKALDLQTFNHFKKVRALCTPEQRAKYDSMVQRMFRKMGKPPARKSEQEKGDKAKAAK